MPGYQEIIGTFGLPVMLVAFMYFMIFLPQKKRDKKFKEMLDALKQGDNIVTAGGIIGKVINIKDEEITIQTSVENTQLKLKRWGIKEILQPSEG